MRSQEIQISLSYIQIMSNLLPLDGFVPLGDMREYMDILTPPIWEEHSQVLTAPDTQERQPNEKAKYRIYDDNVLKGREMSI